MNKEELVKKLDKCFKNASLNAFGNIECHIGNDVSLLVVFNDTTNNTRIRIFVEPAHFGEAVSEYAAIYESMEDVLDHIETALRKYMQFVRWQTVFSSEILEKLEAREDTYQPNPVKTMTMQEAIETKPAWKQHWVQPIQADEYDEREAVREYVASLGEKKLARMEEVCSNDQYTWLVSRGFPHCTIRVPK